MEPCIYLLQPAGPTSTLNCMQAATLAAIRSSVSERYVTDWPGPIYSVQKAAGGRRLSEFRLAGPGPGAEWLCQVPGSQAQRWPDAARELSQRRCLCVPLLCSADVAGMLRDSFHIYFCATLCSWLHTPCVSLVLWTLKSVSQLPPVGTRYSFSGPKIWKIFL